MYRYNVVSGKFNAYALSGRCYCGPPSLEPAPKEGVLLALSCQAIREVLLNDLECVMEQASGSILTGILAAFSAHLPLTPLLWPSTALRLFVYCQANAGVSYFWIL